MQPSARPDRAILLACWDIEDSQLTFLGVTYTTAVAGRSQLQRAVEQLAHSGCKHITVVSGDRLLAAQELLGNGARFGVEIVHRVAPLRSRPLVMLKQTIRDAGSWVYVASANVLDEGVVYEASLQTEPEDQTDLIACWERRGTTVWTGWGIFSQATLLALCEESENEDDLERRVLALPDVRRVRCTAPLNIKSSDDALSALQALIFTGRPGGAVTQRQKGDGIWIGSGAILHPDAVLVPPIFIGKNVLVQADARVGPGSIIEEGSVIEHEAVVEGSWIMAATYIGQRLTLTGVLAAGPHLVNLELDTMIAVTDPRLMAGGVSEHRYDRRPGVVGRLSALLLWVLLMPLAAIMKRQLAHHAAKASDTCRTGTLAHHFVEIFHPGLPDVWRSRCRIIGATPRTSSDIAALPPYWRRLYNNAPIGLLNGALLLDNQPIEPYLAFASDAVAARGLSLSASFRLILRYTLRAWQSLRTSGGQ